MEKELEVKRDALDSGQQRGFILVTALIMLSLLTLLSLGMYMSSRSAIQTSASAQRTTEAYYYAETAINYITWALANDAELDNFTYPGTYQAGPFGEPNVPSTVATVGDFTELKTYLWAPGPIGQAGSSAVDTDLTAYTSGQLKYFDNSPLYTDANNNRPICFYSEVDPGAGVSLTYPNCIDILLDPTDSRRISAQPSMENISASLPRYIKLEISSTGVVTPSIPSLPHRNPPVAGEDIPLNGAVVWLTATAAETAGGIPPPDPDQDIEIFPLDPATDPADLTSGVNGGIDPKTCNIDIVDLNGFPVASDVDGRSLQKSVCPCTAPNAVYDVNQIPAYQADPVDVNYAPFMAAQACDANSGKWLSNYRVAVYAIGYVNGKPSKLLRAVIM
jgi:hypothetical protein